MTNLGNVSVNRPQRQSRLAIQSGQQAPTDFRYPGEPEEGRSRQAQSWVDAGEGFSNWLQMEPFGFFKDIGRGIADFARPAMDWYERTIYPYTPGARFDPNVERPDSWLTNPIGGDWFRQGPEAADTPVTGLLGMGASPDRGAVTETPGRTVEELIALAAQYAPQGPNYDAVRQQLMADTEALNAQLQAMYSAAAERAGENVSRLGDIYGGSRAGIGEAYDVGTGNIEQAYQSAQQQAADQLARLGIEAAAPPVIDPMALSQAESVAGLEAGRAAGLSANERFGGAAQDFASQMAQVAQQEGLGYNQALLAALQGRLGNLAMREAEAQAQYNPLESALQYLQLEQALNPQADPRDAQAEAEFLYRQEQDDTNIFRQYYQGYLEDTAGNQAEARDFAYQDAIAGIMGPRIQQRAMSDPNFILQASQ